MCPLWVFASALGLPAPQLVFGMSASISPVAARATPVPSATQQQEDDDDNEDHFHGKPRSGDE
jgi:hypothetical protein